MGLVKGAPYEIALVNSNPANLTPLSGSYDLILKAMSITDGPFQRRPVPSTATSYIWPLPSAADAAGVRLPVAGDRPDGG